jgi:hypothetical protein
MARTEAWGLSNGGRHEVERAIDRSFEGIAACETGRDRGGEGAARAMCVGGPNSRSSPDPFRASVPKDVDYFVSGSVPALHECGPGAHLHQPVRGGEGIFLVFDLDAGEDLSLFQIGRD